MDVVEETMSNVEQPEFEEIDDPEAEAIAEHVEKYIGPITNVFHEIQPNVVRIDLLVVGPREGHDYTTLVTCGMSEKPMRVPLQDPDDLALVPKLRYAELMVSLPPDWPLTPEAFQQPENFWPLRWLKLLARLPHLQESWLGIGHTIPNGDPSKPLAPNVPFEGWLIDQPLLAPKESYQLHRPEKIVNFYSIIPLYADEMNLKLRKGSGELGALLDRDKVKELIDIHRPSVMRPA
jgi:hypothetical protein